MPEHERIVHRKQTEIDQKDWVKQKQSESVFDQVHAYEEGVSPVTGTPFLPPMESHAALLAQTKHEAQQANLVLRLQRMYGNAYVQRLLESHTVQAELNVSQPDDIYEQEAERVSEVVTRNINSQINRQEEEEEEETETKSLIQRQEQEEEEETGTKSLIQRQEQEEEEETGTKALIQLQEEEEEETQTLSLIQSQSTAVANDLETRIEKERGKGQSLSDNIQVPMEQAFGADFSSVKVHTDAEADTLNRELNARAFTTGQDIFFRQGEYSPGSGGGQKLIAHELTHVVQQKGKGKAQRKVHKQRATKEKTMPGSGRQQRIFASSKRDESPNPFASVSEHNPESALTVSDSITRVTLAQTKSSEVTVQRLSGTLAVPDGDIVADWNGTKISKQFDMETTFSPENEQKYGEYRQYVKGYFSTPSGDLVHNMGAGGTLDRKDYREDGPGLYGHRSGWTNYDAADGKDIYDQPDRPTGKHFLGRDTPSLSPGGTGEYAMDLSFKGELIDTRNSQSFVTKYWHISKTVTKK